MTYRILVDAALLALLCSACVSANRDHNTPPVEAATISFPELSEYYNPNEISTEVNLDFDYIRTSSCSDILEVTPFERIDVVIERQNSLADLALPENVVFVGSWELKSDSKLLDGLSGLTVQPNGDLLAVGDKGSFVSIEISDGIPSGRIDAIEMNGPGGRGLYPNFEADAEGVALLDGIAFVSFERFHRVDAYALETCSGSALPVRIATLPAKIREHYAAAERGAKAIGWAQNLFVHYEEKHKLGGALSVNLSSRWNNGYFPFTDFDWGEPFGGNMVGMTNEVASENGRNKWHYRLLQKPAEVGLQIVSIEVENDFNFPKYAGDASFHLLDIKLPLTLGRFEAIGAQIIAPDKHRIWLLSDNGHLRENNTLLIAIDVEAEYSTEGPGNRMIAD